jgi:RNA polymerase sigma factor (sigma-70 family)
MYGTIHEDSFAQIAQQLPFALDDSQAINRVFSEWYKDQNESKKYIIDLWAYCFVRRYFVAKFTQSARFSPSDADELIEDVTLKVLQNLRQVQQIDRFASWVSVICKNSFNSYLRNRGDEVPIDVLLTLEGDELHPCSSYDYAATYAVVESAIAQLPDFLQEVARMKLLEGLSYQQIEERIEKPVTTIRAYMTKLLNIIRKDGALRSLIE